MDNNFLLYFSLFYFFSFIASKKIIIPFKTSYYSNIDYIKSLLYNHIYTQLEIGDNKQIVNLGISTEESLFAVESSYINESNYNSKKSTSYKNNTKLHIINDNFHKYSEGDILNDTFYFYDSFSMKDIKAFNNIMFGYITKIGKNYSRDEIGYLDNTKKLINGAIGLKITVDYNYENHPSIIKSLKNLNLIENLVWSINYTNDKEGYLILGEHPYQYDSESYSEDKRRKTPCSTTEGEKRDFSWTFSFTDIKVGSNKLNSYRNADYSPQYGLIIGTSEYFSLIKSYFEKLEKCVLLEIEYRKNKYSYYECDKNINNNNFEPLVFVHNELENNFYLDKDDLFIDYNNKKYFLVLFQKESSEQKWALGKPFVKKYQLFFDHESKNILYYEKIAKEESEINYLLIVVIILLSIAAVIIGIIFGKFLVSNKKKKANELDDEINKNYDNNDDYNKLGV